MQLVNSVLFIILHVTLSRSYCREKTSGTFQLVKRCQRSQQSVLELENVPTLNECFEVAERSRALALNYSPLRGTAANLFESNQKQMTGTNFPRRSNRRHFLDQPEQFFNCHALQCPEGSAFSTMTNDTRFDYYSLYGNPPGSAKFACVPEIGIFHLNFTADNYSAAYRQCNQTNGILAHVACEKRTIVLSRLLRDTDTRYVSGSLKLAYVGLNQKLDVGSLFNTSKKKDLSYFLYRAWAPGHPKMDNSSNFGCVALTTEATWVTLDCDRRLPFICELYTSSLNYSVYEDVCDRFLIQNERGRIVRVNG